MIKASNLTDIINQDELEKFCVEFEKEDLKIAVNEAMVAYIHIPYLSPNQSECDPLDVEFYYDSDGFGSICRINLRQELLEYFNDNPNFYKEKMLVVMDALRSLSDEIGKIHNGHD